MKEKNKTSRELAEVIFKITKLEPEMSDGVIRAYVKQISKLAKAIIENEETNETKRPET